MLWWAKFAMNPDFEDELFSAVRIVERQAGQAKDPAEREALSRAYEALREAYNLRARRAKEPDLGWGSQQGGWSTE